MTPRMSVPAPHIPKAPAPAVYVSEWLLVDQDRIDRFAAATDDHQFIHVDPARAAATPFGGTIAHGLLTLSLLPQFAYAILPVREGAQMSVNYGYDRIRFLAPVRSGKRVRARFEVAESVERVPRQWQTIYDVSVEIEGEAKPALVARSISLTYTE
jgi:acyl dehydratase